VFCGHCESICPEGALKHALSPETLPDSGKPADLVDASNLALYFKGRRSIRSFQNKLVDKELIVYALDVARYAPTGHNNQKNEWLVIYDTQVVKQFIAAVVEWFRSVVKSNPEMGKRYGFQGLIALYERGIDKISHNAPHLVISYTPSWYPIGSKDAVIATSHLDLFLPVLGVGTCWAGFIYMALQQSEELKKMIGLDENSTVQAALMIGYPKFQFNKIPERKLSSVKWL
jgi:nitroreductase